MAASSIPAMLGFDVAGPFSQGCQEMRSFDSGLGWWIELVAKAYEIFQVLEGAFQVLAFRQAPC